MALIIYWLAFLIAPMPATAAAQRPCLSYEPAAVKLAGVVGRVTFPGPPNYTSVRRGDRPEVVWVITLARPVCVEGDEVNDPEAGVARVQLVFTEGAAAYRKYRGLVGRRVEVTGKLFHGHTGHHRTDVLIVVEEINRAAR